MKVIDAIARILKIEGAEFLSAYPTTPLIEAAAKAERVKGPEDIAGAFARARQATEGGQGALLEVITSQETRFSNRGVLR